MLPRCSLGDRNDGAVRPSGGPVYLALQPVEEGRQVFTGGLLSGAIYFTTAWSLPYVLDTLVPALAETLAGDGPVTIEVSDDGAVTPPRPGS